MKIVTWMLGSLLLTMVLAPLALAQMSAMPKEVQEKVAAMGTTFTRETIGATINLYTSYAKAAPRDGVKITADLPFGSDPLQKLDVYQPVGKSGVPIVVFVHGGGFVSGDKNGNGEIYGNVPLYFARKGMLGVNINYRLAPARPWPAGAKDVEGAVAWIKNNAAKHGGDPNRIFLVGHSAGATHVASYVFDKSLQPAGGHGVAGVVLLSGLYRVTVRDVAAPEVKAYFGDDPGQFAARSPISHVPGSSVPVFIVTAEYDPFFLALPSADLMMAICLRDKACPRFTRLRHHNHISEATHLNTADESLGPEIIEFIQTLR